VAWVPSRWVIRHRKGPPEPGPDVAALAALVRRERANLSRLRARRLAARAAEDRIGAADRARFDDAKAMTLCLRYATAASRDLHRSVAALSKLRKAREADGPAEPPSSGSDPVAAGPTTIESLPEGRGLVRPAAGSRGASDGVRTEAREGASKYETNPTRGRAGGRRECRSARENR